MEFGTKDVLGARKLSVQSRSRTSVRSEGHSEKYVDEHERLYDSETDDQLKTPDDPREADGDKSFQGAHDLILIFFFRAILYRSTHDLFDNFVDHIFRPYYLMDPQTRDDLLLDPGIVDDMARWFESCKRGDIAIIKAASAGCGVSTAIRLLASDARCEPIFVTTGLSRLNAFLRDVSSSLYTALERRKKVIVLDPVDALFADQTAAGDILDYIKTSGDKSAPIVCAGFLQRASLAKVRDVADPKRCTYIEFPKIETERALKALLAAFGATLPRDTIHSAWDNSCGDLRSCIAGLSIGNDVGKDIVCDGADAVKRVLFGKGVTLEEAMSLHDGDAQLVTMGVFENYQVSAPDLRTCLEVADAFSVADVVEERIYGNQEWHLADFYAAMTTGVPAMVLPKIGYDEPWPEIEKFGSVWSRSNNQRSKQKSLRDIAIRLQEMGRTTVPAEDVAYLRGMFLWCSKNNDFVTFCKLARDLDDSTVLSIMRLFKVKYTQTDHSRFKKARRAA